MRLSLFFFFFHFSTIQLPYNTTSGIQSNTDSFVTAIPEYNDYVENDRYIVLLYLQLC